MRRTPREGRRACCGPSSPPASGVGSALRAEAASRHGAAGTLVQAVQDVPATLFAPTLTCHTCRARVPVVNVVLFAARAGILRRLRVVTPARFVPLVPGVLGS